jgi:hypothetical protein
MDGHSCRSLWDPLTRANTLRDRLNQIKAQQGHRGWGVDLADQAVFNSLMALKIELEHARGVMSAPEGEYRLGAIPGGSLKADADSIAGGLRAHSNGPEHADPVNAPGQFGWILMVDPLTPTVDLDTLMMAVRDCLDNPPGDGGPAQNVQPPKPKKKKSKKKKKKK